MKLEDILLDPSAAYDTPRAVVEDDNLSQEEKISVLHHWEQDVRREISSAGEGMAFGHREEGPSKALDEVLNALEMLGAEPGVE